MLITKASKLRIIKHHRHKGQGLKRQIFCSFGIKNPILLVIAYTEIQKAPRPVIKPRSLCLCSRWF